MDFKGMNKRVILVITIALCCSSCVLWAQETLPSVADTVPQMKYKLPVAKKIFYTSKSETQYAEGSIGSVEQLQIWVLRQNDNKSWRLVLRNHSSPYQVDKKGKRKDAPTDIKWAICDFYAEGHFDTSSTLDNMWRLSLYLPNLFIPLPEDLSSSHIEWSAAAGIFGETSQFILEKPAEAERVWIIKAQHKTPLDPIYLMSQKAELYFDIDRGFPVYKKRESTRGFGSYAGRGTDYTILDSIVNLDTAVAKSYVRELLIYFQADSMYEMLMEQAVTDPPRMYPLIERAEATIKQARQKITRPEIKQILDERIAEHDEEVKYVIDQVRHRAGLLSKPSVTWTAEDFDDEKHSLNQYDRKVVVLDFWYRGCPWCLRLMPQIERVAQYFEGKPVIVLGMNVDKNKDDARFVIDKLKPIYDNISAKDVAKKYGITGYPTLIIIDQKGIVKEMHVGYTPDLFDKIVASIESLLQNY